MPRHAHENDRKSNSICRSRPKIAEALLQEVVGLKPREKEDVPNNQWRRPLDPVGEVARLLCLAKEPEMNMFATMVQPIVDCFLPERKKRSILSVSISSPSIDTATHILSIVEHVPYAPIHYVFEQGQDRNLDFVPKIERLNGAPQTLYGNEFLGSIFKITTPTIDKHLIGAIRRLLNNSHLCSISFKRMTLSTSLTSGFTERVNPEASARISRSSRRRNVFKPKTSSNPTLRSCTSLELDSVFVEIEAEGFRRFIQSVEPFHIAWKDVYMRNLLQDNVETFRLDQFIEDLPTVKGFTLSDSGQNVFPDGRQRIFKTRSFATDFQLPIQTFVTNRTTMQQIVDMTEKWIQNQRSIVFFWAQILVKLKAEKIALTELYRLLGIENGKKSAHLKNSLDNELLIELERVNEDLYSVMIRPI